MIREILCVTCVISFAFGAIANSAILLDKVMAIVNKEVITWSDLYKAMEFEATDEIKAMKDDDRRRFFKENEAAFLETMIDMRLQLQEASRTGISIGDEEVAKAIEGIKKKYSMTDEMFKNAISKEGFTITEYKKKLADQIAIGRVVEHEVKSKILITEGELDQYLSENKEIRKESDGFNISHVFFRKADDRQQVEAKAADIYKKIKAGGNFSETARQYSEDASAQSGGDLGFIKKSDLSKEFLDVLSKMKDGDVSEPFWSGNGIHILRLNERKEFKNPQELREAVRQKLMSDKYTKEYRSWIKGLRERAYVEIKL
ncbi:MAG: peptidylprolyl isomerase [Nitrospirae bacterium]|nr:peptidylprolyl isomerase [Nitrospirota bacterium]MCL5977176.1 peptidylprolyl isomerase [Nitrospirota bacterium]